MYTYSNRNLRSKFLYIACRSWASTAWGYLGPSALRSALTRSLLVVYGRAKRDSLAPRSLHSRPAVNPYTRARGSQSTNTRGAYREHESLPQY